MKGEDTTFREELRDIETGWVPWVLAAAYFPVYILLDFTVGDLAATRLGLPRSVAVGVVSLSISLVVVLLFVIVNLRSAAPQPSHGMGSSGRRMGSGWRRLVSPFTSAVLAVFVASRDLVAILLAGLWSIVAGIGGVAYRILAVLTRPIVLMAFIVKPVHVVATAVAGIWRNETPANELNEPLDRRRYGQATSTTSPLQRADVTTGERPDGQAVETGVAGGDPTLDERDDRIPQEDEPVPEQDERDVDDHDGSDVREDDETRVDAAVVGATEGMIYPGDSTTNGDLLNAAEPANETAGLDEEDTAEASDGSAETSEESVDDPDEEEWPDDWIPASEV